MNQTACFEMQLNEQFNNLMRLASRLCRNGACAEDLFQDTMVLALRFRDSYRDGTNMRAWLSRIMKNRHISILRRRSLETHIMESEGHHALKEWSVGEMGLRATSKDGGVHRDEGFCDTVRSAIDELKPEYRQVVMLCDIDELSYAEAADRLTCPLGTIMSRLHRGRRALRDVLVSRERLDQAA
jgi:RNA polymerase sigma-70 factor (ECF subfamily)